MIEALRSGRHGLQLQVPNDLRLIQDDDHFAEVQGPGLVYHLFWFPDLHLVFRPGLEAAMQHHARLLFDDAFTANGGQGQKRTDDASWSPLVETEALTIDGAPAMRTVHRMLYQHGREMVMSHLMVPLQGGLFETRVTALDTTTGFRECAVLLLRNVKGFLPQKDYDDPQYDQAFPQHSLSRVRAGLRVVWQDWQPRVLSPAPAFPDAEVQLPRLGCALRPPPGFVHAAADSRYERFERTSFCGTDGRESFLVERRPQRLKAAHLRKTAESETRAVHHDVDELHLHVDELGDRILVIAEGRGHRGRLRNAILWFLDGSGRLCSLALISSAAVPVSALGDELAAAAASFHVC